ncbi:MAG: hypothetical protein U1D30_00720 [Planctomycetota bacterium]
MVFLNNAARPRRWMDKPLAFLFRGVPEISSEALALYRIVLGTALFVSFAVAFKTQINSGVFPVSPSRPALHLARYFPPAQSIAQDLDKFETLRAATLVALALFTLGIWPRISMFLASLGLILFEFVCLSGGVSCHVYWVPVSTTLGLTLAPWDDTLSIRRLWNKSHVSDSKVRSKRLGYAVWIPGLLLGLAYIGAGTAKLYASGWSWISSGAVKYHFVEDAGAAPLNWGILIAGNHDLSVFLSFGAVALEIVFLLVVFFPGEWIRVFFAIVGLGLHLGLLLFQGLWWQCWISLYLCFVPWQSIADRCLGRASLTAPTLPRKTLGLGFAQVAFSLYFMMQQVFASVCWKEHEPLCSMWGMYSWTYTSLDEMYEQKRWYKYQRYHFVDATNNKNITENVYQMGRYAVESVVEACKQLHNRETLTPHYCDRLEKVRLNYLKDHGKEISIVHVRMDQQGIDFDKGEFYWQLHGVPIGTVDLLGKSASLLTKDEETQEFRRGTTSPSGFEETRESTLAAREPAKGSDESSNSLSLDEGTGGSNDSSLGMPAGEFIEEPNPKSPDSKPILDVESSLDPPASGNSDT